MLQHICKAGNGHVPKAAENDDDDPKPSGGWFNSHKKKNWFTKSKEPSTSAAQAATANPSSQSAQPQGAAAKAIEVPTPLPATEETQGSVTSEEKLARSVDSVITVSYFYKKWFITVCKILLACYAYESLEMDIPIVYTTELFNLVSHLYL